jgi:hypothetical protein
MRHFLYLCFFLVIGTLTAKGQVQHTGWLASFNTFGLNNKWSVHFDAQVRSSNRLQQVQSVLLRSGLNYHINKKLTATGGYAYIPNRRTAEGFSAYLAEHRIWEQLVFAHKIERVASSHRLRFEQRFLPQATVVNNKLETDNYRTAYRLRYFTRHVLPLVNQPTFTKGWFAALQDEVFVNTGNKTAVNGRFFDQNRLYLALGYRLPHSKIDLEAGYMNQYTKTRTAFVNNHIAQLAIYKRL